MNESFFAWLINGFANAAVPPILVVGLALLRDWFRLTDYARLLIDEVRLVVIVGSHGLL